MAELFVPALFGLTGGLIRAVVGLLKHYRIDKDTKFKINYFIITLTVSAFIGMIISTAFVTNYLISLVVGYAGIDLLENLVKITEKKD